MQTPWGDLEVSDAHVHLLSRAFFASLGTPGGRSAAEVGAVLGWEVPEADPAAPARRWLAELDAQGVESACVIASVHGDEGSAVAAAGVCPERMHAYFMLNPLAADALERVRGALHAGARGICLFPAMHRYPVQDARVEPVLEAAASLPGTVVFVHCGVLTVGVRKKLGLPSPFDMRFSNPIDLHAVALRYPQLRFVVPHFGAGYFREALMLADLCANVYLDTSSTNSWLKYQPGDIDLPTVFRRTLDVTGPGRLLFGTDSSFFPRGWHGRIFEQQVSCLHQLGIGAADARRIFGGNLREMLGNS